MWMLFTRCSNRLWIVSLLAFETDPIDKFEGIEMNSQVVSATRRRCVVEEVSTTRFSLLPLDVAPKLSILKFPIFGLEFQGGFDKPKSTTKSAESSLSF